jgi:hypothetical protein
MAARPPTEANQTVERMGGRPRLPEHELALIAEAYELVHEGVASWRDPPRPRTVFPRCHLCRRELYFAGSFTVDRDGDRWCVDHDGCSRRARYRLSAEQSWSLRRAAERLSVRYPEEAATP